ncbi:transcription initiation factor IIF, beta subunit domain-containing protein [Phthorimaea operculella]|nr:transcription initiation factor IIF, beta subunit domain-containing protein [Phthorimaea operculella]
MNTSIKPQIDHQLDLSNTVRGVWLVKVPKYIANKWKKSGNIEVGILNISKMPGQRAQVKLSLSEALLCLKEPGEQSIPKELRLDVSNVTRQSLGVFSHAAPSNSDAVVPEAEKLYMEGRIVQKLECRPNADSTYYQLKAESIRKATKPRRQVQQLDSIVPPKPGANRKHNIEYEKRKKAEGKKYRAEKDAVLNMLFAAFEKHQYYNIKDLQKVYLSFISLVSPT